LAWLRAQLIKARTADKLDLIGLKEERKAVIAGGLSVLTGVFDLLKIDSLNVAKGALRHGLLYDMMGQDDDSVKDLRNASINNLITRFAVNKTQANNVAKVALVFFNGLLSNQQGFTLNYDVRRLKQKLGWAALCHEVGCAISHSESQKHGAYIVDNTELMGFAQSELHRLSLLVLGHCGKLRKLDADFNDESFIYQLISLRLAVIFCHSRHMPVLKNIHFECAGNTFLLNLPSAWQQAFPQTSYLLEEEVLAWQKANWSLVVSTHD
jgi:exopolyphosphatase/guanosine-5'-triphosphate,3'-diphosphate pyrophosphatase